MPDTLFDKTLAGQAPEQKEINEINEKEFLKSTKERNKKSLIKLGFIERERIAKYIKDEYTKAKTKHNELCDRIDKYDDTYHMRPNDNVADSDTPNYRTPLSTVTLEVIHANEMNVFFTPKDVMKVIPTEEGDIPKVSKLDTFGNWSMENEMDIERSCDRLFHASAKNGECPYIVHWVKEYGTEIKIEPVMNPADLTQPLIDDDTKEVITQEIETEKLLYNGPRLEIFSRKDYIRPLNAMRGKLNDWDMRKIRLNSDKVLRYEMEGKYYTNTFDDIGGWGVTASGETKLIDSQGDEVPLGKSEKQFMEFYGRLRINAIKTNKEGEEAYEELEDEFIAVIEMKSETLCNLRKNRFPLKMRPIGLDEFMPDDEGRAGATGVMEFMEATQEEYDALHNQFLKATVQANDPFGFYTPYGNQKNEPIKVSHGYMYPTSDPQSVNVVKLPGPDQTLRQMMEEVRNFSQLLFGISDYSAGIESQIDPRAPAKKAEIVVAQGNVRLNLIIKRKNQTLKDIFKRWFLLYQANMPPNKFMRIAGEDKKTPWKFDKMNITDFALKSIPDFELTGNVLNANKTLEAQKAMGIYQLLMANPFFIPQTTQGMQALHALTKWFLDKLDETGVSNFLPSPEGEMINTPEEENARFLQGDSITPVEQEDHIDHIRKHGDFIKDPTLPEEIVKVVIRHIQEHVKMLKDLVTQQVAMSQRGQTMPQGGQGGGQPGTPAGGQRPVSIGGLGSP